MILIPAYGRDYTSKKAMLVDFDSNKDFRICDMSLPDDGRYTNKKELLDSGMVGKSVNIRYKKLTQIAVIKLK